MKRTPLKRNRDAHPRRRPILSRGNPQYVEQMASARKKIDERADGLCEAGVACGGKHRGNQLHHRKRRSQGGPNKPFNLILVCNDCHVMIHRYPERSYNAGLLVRSSEDPGSVEVRPGAWRD